ncbi:MAG: hypothetical protein KDD89_02375 [Anaerolineales bacterium]|nr:hypothetical protein [Anaerolineales bacterium]
MTIPLTQMSDEQFAQLIDNYVTQTATASGEMPATSFLDLLAEQATKQTEAVMTLAVQIDDDQIVLLPDQELPEVIVRGNEIFIGKHRLVLHVSPTV